MNSVAYLLTVATEVRTVISEMPSTHVRRQLRPNKRSNYRHICIRARTSDMWRIPGSTCALSRRKI